MLCSDLNARTFLSWQKQLSEQFYLFILFYFPSWSANGHLCYHSELAPNIAYRHLQLHIRLSWILVPRGLAWSQAGRSPGDGKQVWKWTCSPSVPPSSLCCCNEEQWLYSWREGTPSDPPSSSSPSCPRQSTVTLLASQQMTGLGRIWPPCT